MSKGRNGIREVGRGQRNERRERQPRTGMNPCLVHERANNSGPTGALARKPKGLDLFQHDQNASATLCTAGHWNPSLSGPAEKTPPEPGNGPPGALQSRLLSCCVPMTLAKGRENRGGV